MTKCLIASLPEIIGSSTAPKKPTSKKNVKPLTSTSTTLIRDPGSDGSYGSEVDSEYDESPVPTPAQRVENKYRDFLKSIGAIFNSEYRILICIKHGGAVQHNGIKTHFGTEHGLTKKDTEKLMLILPELELLANSEASNRLPRNSLVRPIEGLEVVDGFVCSICYAASTSTRGFERKQCNPIGSSHSIQGQQKVSKLFTCASPYFAIDILWLEARQHLPNAEGNFVMQMMDSYYQMIPSSDSDALPSKPSYDDITPFMQEARYHEHLVDIPLSRIRKLCQVPRRPLGAEAGLLKGIDHAFEELFSTFRITGSQVRAIRMKIDHTMLTET